MTSHPLAPPDSRWPHRWAWVLACATFPLVWWGGFVTATGSGMAFRDWLTSDGVFMPLYPWFNSAGAKFIEHGHRLLGMTAGLVTIALVASLWRGEPRRWVRWYGAVLLAGVIFQGVLGGQRVQLDEHAPDQARLIALIHGCTGPLFFVGAVGMVVVTSRRWKANVSADRNADPKLLRLAALTACLAFLQLVLGAIVRHSPYLLGDRAAAIFQLAVYFHVFMAFAVTFHVVWLAVLCLRRGVCRAGSAGLAALLGVQVLLGVSSWVVKYGMPSWAIRVFGETGHFNRESDLASAAVLAAHGAVGSLIVALAVVIALHVGRRVGLQSSTPRIGVSQLKGAPA